MKKTPVYFATLKNTKKMNEYLKIGLVALLVAFLYDRYIKSMLPGATA